LRSSAWRWRIIVVPWRTSAATLCASNRMLQSRLPRKPS
jgi:hypothetical protein